jgi:hypothetical protein
MNYVWQINAFHRFRRCRYLPLKAQLLWFDLMDLCNTCGWPEWIQIDDARLAAMLGSTDKHTAYRARDALSEAGLLEYVTGSKGVPTRYRLRDLADVPLVYAAGNDTANDAQITPETTPEVTPETGLINKQEINETKRNKQGVPAELCEVFGAYAEMRKKLRKPLTDAASKLVLDTLETLAPGRYDAQKQILEQSVLNGWAGVYPLKETEAPEPPASYDVGELERRLLYGKIEYRKRE